MWLTDGGGGGLSNSSSSFYSPSPRDRSGETPTYTPKKFSSSTSRDRSWENTTDSTPKPHKKKKSSSSSSRDRSWESTTDSSPKPKKSTISSSSSSRDRSWEDTTDSTPKHHKKKKSSSSSIRDRSWENSTNPKPSNIHADDDREARRISPSTIHADDGRENRRLNNSVTLPKSQGSSSVTVRDRSWESTTNRKPARYKAGQRDSSARDEFLASQGLDPSGRPIIFIPPKPSAPKPPQKKSLLDRFTNSASVAWDATKKAGTYTWKHKGTIGHGALDIIGVVDPFGIADSANAIWYAAEGDWTNAGISAAGIIPYVGDVGKVAKWGGKAVKATDKADNVAKVIEPPPGFNLSTESLLILERHQSLFPPARRAYAVGDGIVFRSGRVGDTEAVTRVMKAAQEMGHEFPSRGILNPIDYASHAELKALVNKPGTSVVVDRSMCNSCQEFAQNLAKHTGVAQVVSDPKITRFFTPDGKVSELTHWG